MKKRFPVMITALVCTASLAIGVGASGVIKKITAELRPDFTVVVDGEKQTFKNAQGDVVEPILYEGTTYLPLRAVGELMGKKVYWYENDKKIELKTEKESTVTDADVIVDEEKVNNAADKGKNGKGEKPDKPVKDEHKEKKEKFEKQDEPVDITGVIKEEQAKKNALKKAALNEDEVKFIKIKLDKEDGRRVYEIKFVNGNKEYEAEIDALTGEITEWDVEIED